ncbi:Choline/ethanolaminephosphotransferase 1 [Myotis brandtii]|uniref:Choline/ethanolaminephosphotransferase 1 n=1 Tax=Myotis brandtii TaxID=109478 RepID=S7MUR3_MYOBR|nr:Choline/ethanolaminephosphotransferase 1 [Myotis brandtii]
MGDGSEQADVCQRFYLTPGLEADVCKALHSPAFTFLPSLISDDIFSQPTPFTRVAHMTKSEMHLHDTAFIGPALLFLDQYFNSFIDEYIVLWIALVFSFFDLIRYCVSVCNQIASHLHIHVFRIKVSTAHSNHH